MLTDDLIQQAAENGRYLQSRLAAVQSSYPDTIVRVCGMGLHLSLTLDQATTKHALVDIIAAEYGYRLLETGPSSVRVLFNPDASQADLDRLVDALVNGLQKVKSARLTN